MDNPEQSAIGLVKMIVALPVAQNFSVYTLLLLDEFV
jgi:hypothetical protein